MRSPVVVLKTAPNYPHVLRVTALCRVSPSPGTRVGPWDKCNSGAHALFSVTPSVQSPTCHVLRTFEQPMERPA